LEYSSLVNIRNILSNMYVQENPATISETNRRTVDQWQCWQLSALALSSIKITGHLIMMLHWLTIYKEFLFQITSGSCWWMLANLSQNIQCTVIQCILCFCFVLSCLVLLCFVLLLSLVTVGLITKCM
jgi:hypothetical protein